MQRKNKHFARRDLYGRVAVVAACACVVLLVVVAVVIVRCSAGGSNSPDSSQAKTQNAITASNDAIDGASSGGASAQGTPAATPTPVPEVPLTTDVYALNPPDMLTIPGSDDVISLNFSPGGQPVALTDDQLQPVRAALDQVRENGSCGFVFLDVETGHGLAYNADEVFYIASASKAMLAYYAIGEDDAYDGNIESAIIDSSNEAYESFGYRYFTSDYIDWLGERDIDHATWSGDLYPKTATRSLACVWAEILQFMREGSEEAQWFAELLSNTNHSYIRDAVEDRGALVMNKAGWISDPEFDSITDAAIVQAGGRTYLMVIESDQPAWGAGDEATCNLAGALFDLRLVM